MSRQKGRRERPAPERREFQKRYERRSRRERKAERTALTERPVWTDDISPGRRWAAVMAGTLAAMFSYGLIAAAIVRANDGFRDQAVLLSIGAALLVPVMLLLVAFVSRHRSPWYMTALGSPLMVLLFLAVSPLVGDPATGFALAVGVGGSLAMRATEGVHSHGWRLGVAVALAVYTKLVYLASPEIAIIAAPILPLAGIGMIDRIRERRLER